MVERGDSLEALQNEVVAFSGPMNSLRGMFGESLLSHAVYNGRIGFARWLLAQGADPDGISPSGAVPTITPLFSAVFTSNLDAVEMLLEAGADPHLVVNEGATALVYAKYADDERILKMMEEY